MHWAKNRIIIVSIVFMFFFQLSLPDALACWWKGLPYQSPGTGGGSGNGGGDDDGGGSGGDPVYLNNGDNVYASQDLLIPSLGLNIEIIRIYKTQSRFNGRFGLGWEMSYNKRIDPLSNGDLFYYNGEGRRWRFIYIDGTNYISPSSVFDSLVQNVDGTYTLTRKHGTKYNFNSNGTISEIVDRDNNRLSFSYDPAGSLPVIGVPVYSSDTTTPRLIGYQHKLTKVTDAGGREVDFTYDGNGRLTEIVDFAGRRILYGYDDLGHMVSAADPEGNVTYYDYDSDRNIYTITDPVGDIYLTNTYDQVDRVIAQEYGPDTFYFDYDTGQSISTFTNRRGSAWTYKFDENGNPTEITDSMGNTTLKTYDTNNKMLLITYTDPRDHTFSYEYDDNGNNTKITDPPGNITNFVYEATFNRITSITDPLGRTAYFVYDAKGHLTRITNTASEIVNYTYDSSGILTGIEDVAANDELSFTHDANGYLTKVTAKDGTYVDYAYDDVGNITSISKNGEAAATFTYNDVSQPVSMTDPSGGETTISYDADGRMTSITYPTGQGSLAFTYLSLTPLGLITSVTNHKGDTTSFSYQYGMVSSMTDSKGGTTNYTYNAINRLTGVSYPDGSSVSYGYDAAGNVTGVANATSLSHEYDALDRLTSITDTVSGETTSYTYNVVGNRITMTNTSGTISYTYDNLNRLTQITHPDSSITDLSADPVRKHPERIILSGIATLYNNNEIELLFWYLRGCSFSEVVSREAMPLTVGRLPESSTIGVEPDNPLVLGHDIFFDVYSDEQKRLIDMGMY